MSAEVSIPLWVFLLFLIITALAILDRLMIPSVRWFFRRRVNRVIDEITNRLDIEIRPFQLTKRQILIDRLTYDPKVLKGIQQTAQERGVPRALVQAEIMAYAREIVPSFNAYLYFRIGYWVAKKIARLLYGVRVELVDNEKLASIDSGSTVVFVMNHRSNMDYVLVAFLAAERTTLSYAVGEWARIWPLQTLIKAMGAYFVRRNSGNPLYRLVLERYVHMATKEGVCQALFLEGGLSRDGKMRSPKFGLIDYMLRDFDHESDRDIVFIPVGINYDRTLEDRSLIRTLDPLAERRSSWFVAKTTLGFILHNLILMAFNKWQRFGYACVNFGTPISMTRFCQERSIRFIEMDRDSRFNLVRVLCDQLMVAIEGIIPVLPISVVSTVLLEHGKGWISEFDLKGHVYNLMEELKRKGAPVYIPKRGRELAISSAFNMLKLRRMIKESDGLLMAESGSRDILAYYANAMVHWIQDR